MPNIFKALASITAWVLFVNGLVTVVGMYGIEMAAGRATESWPMEDVVAIGFGIVSLIGGVVAMTLRKGLE